MSKSLTRIILIGAFIIATAQEARAEEAPAADGPAPAEAAAAVEEEEETNYPDGWFRVDTDILSTQLWFGATFGITDNVGFATDIYLVGTFAELDLGFTFSKGIFSITPMAGIGFDFGSQKFASLVAPQLFTIVAGEKLYFESWVQFFFNDMFESEEDLTNLFYTRNFLLVNTSDSFAIGLQAELEWDFKNPGGREVPYLPIGLRMNINYGENNTLGLFLGYDVRSVDPSDGVAGRFTFVRTW